MKKLTIFTVLAFLLVLCATPVYASDIPAFPHAFYGSVKINNVPAPVGTSVEARGDGVATGRGNPIITTVHGIYGTSNPYEPRLLVQGDIQDGTIITFHVTTGYGTAIGGTYLFKSGETTDLPLLVFITPPPPPPTPPTPVVIEVTTFGIEASITISDEGEIQETVTATSADGNLSMTIPAGTIALDKDGEPLSSLTAAVDPSPPAPPEGDNIIGLAYDFGPAGATFDPPITLEYTYDPADIPEGVAEADLVLAFYNEATGEWVELPCTVDPVSHRIIASVSHFTIFAIIAYAPFAPPPAPAAFSLSNLTANPARVQPGEAVTVAVHVANTGGTEGIYSVVLKINGIIEAEKIVTIAAGGREIVTFSVTKEAAGSYSVTVDGLSGSFTVAPLPPPPPPPPPPTTPAAFLVSNLSIQPGQVQTGEAVTIDVAVTNTGGTEGSYTVVLKINGVKEADRTVTIAAGDTLNLIFPVTKEAAGSYSVTVDGLSGSFNVVAPAVVPGVTNWPLIGGIIGIVIAIGLLVFLIFIRRRRAY